MSERTLRRWLQDPFFARAYKLEQNRLLHGAMNILRTKLVDAANTLGEIARDAEATDSSRVAAARSIIDIVLRGTEMEELRRRVEELEELIREKQC